MYQGVKTNHTSSLLYTTLFCTRRLILVCSLIALQKRDFGLILVYNGIQTFYFWYIIIVKPHEENIHNWLEIFNELSVIAM